MLQHRIDEPDTGPDHDEEDPDEDPSVMYRYRSVGTNTANLNTDSRTVEIVGTTATFSDTMPDNVGVGDALTYNNGSNQLAFIHGRISDTVYTVKDKDGRVPGPASALTAVNVYRSYTSRPGR